MIPAFDLDYRCCTLDDGHDGACVWECSTCHGQGVCWLCNGKNGMDDMPWCDECVIGLCEDCGGDGKVSDDR